MAKASSQLHGVGRRKSSVARVWVKPGKGSITVNGRKHTEYFDTDLSLTRVISPIAITGKKDVDIVVNVTGGGVVSQAGATCLGIARAFLAGDEALRPTLRKNGLLTVDARVKERKKYGQRGARRKFQFVKR